MHQQAELCIRGSIGYLKCTSNDRFKFPAIRLSLHTLKVESSALMEVTLNWENLFYLGSQFVGGLIGLVLVIYGFKRRWSNLFLGLNYLILTYASFIIWLIISGFFVHFPHLYRTGGLAGFLFIPWMYLYIKSVITNEGLKWKDVIHFLPAIIFAVDFWPSYFFDTEQKIELIKAQISDPAVFTSFSQSRFFPDNFYTPLRNLTILLYWALSVFWIRKGSKKYGVSGFYKEWFVWIGIFLFLELLVFFPALLFSWSTQHSTAFMLAHGSIILLNLGMGVSILFFPKVLYGLDQKHHEGLLQTSKSKVEVFQHLSDDRMHTIGKGIENALTIKMSHLQPGYSLSDLSKQTEIPTYLLTQYIGKELNTTFIDLVNRRRIDYCCSIIESGNFDYLSVEGFAAQSGFSNRNSFSMAFKKFRGVSPSVYIKAHRAKS